MKSIFFMNLITVLCFLSSCGLGFYFKKQITGQYYLVAMDTKEQLNIAYRDGATNSYSGRVPHRVIEFGFSDSLIVAKSINNVNQAYYYIISAVVGVRAMGNVCWHHQQQAIFDSVEI